MWQKVLRHFTPKPKPLLGIDVSSSTIKLLELSANGPGYLVKSFAIVPFGKEGVVKDKIIQDHDTAVDVLRRGLKLSKTTAKDASVAVADSTVITKVIQMPADLSEDEIENQIALEADKYIPYPLEEVSLDFQVIGKPKTDANVVDVLLVASRRQNVESRTDVIADVGLTPKIVDVESFAMERAAKLICDQLSEGGRDKTVAIIDIGSFMTNVIVMHNMMTIFTREEIFGGEQLTLEIQRYYGLDYKEAGLAKKTGNLPDDYETEVLAPFRESAVLQIRRALQFFYSASDYNEIHQVVLAGGGATIPGLREFIEKQLNIPTMIANPFANMAVSSNVDAEKLTRDSAAMMMCCGLAMRGLINDD